MADETQILEKLVVEEKDIIKELEKTVEEASKYFSIERPSGRINFQNYGSLNDKQRIATLLLGKYYAQKLKIIDNASLSISEIAKELGRPMTTLSKSVGELRDKGYIEYLTNGKRYIIAYHRIKEIFSDVLAIKQKRN